MGRSLRQSVLSRLFRINPHKRFWEWFQANSDQLAAVKNGEDPILQELSHELQRVHPKLTFEMGLGEDDPFEFIVSADGISSVFPAVEQLVAAAPILANWKIIAFRQPKGADFGILYEDFPLEPEDVWFSYRPRNDKIDVTIYIRNLSSDNDRQAVGASFILLDNALGEYMVATGIGLIEHKPLPDDPVARGLSPLSDIRKIVDRG